MFKNEVKNKMMAMAVVAMFMLSACAMVLAPNDADPAYTDQTYTIYLNTGDTFTYTPTANLTGTTFTFYDGQTATTPLAKSGAFSESTLGTTLVYHPTTAGEQYVYIKASHGSGDLLQEKYQILHFIVVEKVKFSSSNTTGNATVDLAAKPTQTAIGETYSVTGGATTSGSSIATFNTSTYTVKLGDSETDIKNAASETITVSFTNSNKSASLSLNNVTVSDTPKVFTVSLPASFTTGGTGDNNHNATDSAVLTITVTVTPDLALVTKTWTAYVGMGNGSVSKTLETTNDTGVSSIAYTITQVDNGQTVVNTTNSIAGSTLTFNTNGVTNATIGNNDSMDINFTISITGTNSAGSVTSPDQLCKITMYKALEFTTSPVVTGDHVAYASSVNTLDVLMTTYFSGAKKLVYNWGDGTVETKEVIPSAQSTMYAASHSYARAGTYMIDVTASNDKGSTTATYLYDAYGGLSFDQDNTLKITTIKTNASGDSLTLDANVIHTAGYTPTYKWFYTVKGGQKTEIAAVGTPDFVTSIDGKSITVDTTKVADNTVFTIEASITFSGDTKATTASASYTYNDTSFLAQYGWILWVIPVIIVVILVASLLILGFTPITIGAMVILALVELVLIVSRYFGVL